MRFNKFMLFLLVSGLLLAACGSASGSADSASLAGQSQSGEQAGNQALQMMMIVAPQMVNCGDDGSRLCLQVKFDPEEDWQVLDSAIEGFDYEPGYRYTLLVEHLDRQDPPAQSANAQYVLVLVQDQLEEFVATAENLEGITWLLTAMGDVSAPEGVLEKVQVTLVYSSADARLFGSAGCNRYFGEVQINADQLVFTTSPMGMGRMACSDQVMAQEHDYIDMLSRTERYAMDGNFLYLFTNAGEVLMFEPDTDSGS